MRKALSVTVLILFILITFGCTTMGGTSKPALPNPVVSLDRGDSPVNMANLDDFIGRADVQLVDLRNFQDKFSSGYIRGFELIPFFQFLEGRLVTRSKEVGQGWNPEKGTVNKAFPLENYFNKDMFILLMCASGTRAGYIKGILDKNGYRVYNLGGFKHYEGKYKVIGDPDYSLKIIENESKTGPLSGY